MAYDRGPGISPVLNTSDLMRRAARVDANHNAVVEALQRIGCRVQSLAAVGRGVPDLLVGTPDGRLVLFEVKDGTKPPSERRLTADQESWHATWRRWPVYVVNSAKEAVDAVSE